MERVAIFVDGANFYYGLKSVNARYNDFHFDFEKYFQTISKGKKFVGFWYYTAPIKGNQSLNQDHQIMLSRLNRIVGHNVRLCRRQPVPPAKMLSLQSTAVSEAQNSSNSSPRIKYENKMDDVWLAADMVNEAWKNTYDTAILISGDGDILPAVEIIKSLGKKVELIGFVDRVSYTLIQACSSYETVGKKIIRNHFFPYRKPSQTNQKQNVGNSATKSA